MKLGIPEETVIKVTRESVDRRGFQEFLEIQKLVYPEKLDRRENRDRKESMAPADYLAFLVRV